MPTETPSDKPEVVSPGRQPIFPMTPDLPEILRNVPQSLVTDVVMMVRRGLAAEKLIAEQGGSEEAAKQATAVVRLSAESANFLREYVRRMITQRAEMKKEMAAMALVAMEELGVGDFEREYTKLMKVPEIVQIATAVRTYMHRTKSVTENASATSNPEEAPETVKQKITVAGELVRLSKLQAHEDASLLAKAVLNDDPTQRDKYLKRLASLKNHEKGERRGEVEADPELMHAVYNAVPSSVLYATCAKAISIRAKSAEAADRTRFADAQIAISAYERAMQVQDENLEKVMSSCTKDIAALKTLVAQLEASIAKADRERAKRRESEK